ncbi:hypothetical protein F4802DRAFT_545618 [Xylaria palmicola]|nr:hypothetical protein F4802DRAFT_545618 [Xylaria palmicola]
MKLYTAPTLLALCLSGVLADLPYHDFKGRDAYINDVPPHHTVSKPHGLVGTGTGGHHHHHHHTPPNWPEQIAKRDKHGPHPHHSGTAYPTAWPTGGHPHPGPHHHHHPPPEPNIALHTPPYPTDTRSPLGGGDECSTWETVTRTRGPSGGFPHGTGHPYPTRTKHYY